ncbi:Trafficking protein particle complex subunit 31 [Komagataella phaffii CBS 7435]|uniref:Trafficking protein particle complex subunit n=2 Tax=Komagataella phaffii TaxID=460519 RepID=C4QV75_KOMPG|nr:One of 10 subunits of the transport protein particle (TRAPP) complex of the cis-Golgi [Komagataella phaffii GS115]AOA60565.1 GQ67_02343T0 [Komagataella phaffii]CAH2445800.1 Trafficking protein particle complex subunit 31 [Komagataella phaffii CBS 7435]AOA66122.1 GQ68_02904T0 [Komagataella phaffii GS115]CAY67148.1 One of 10 subunits of the transport protein particle (TRAPP) complex of the cis-Golgi [Komagataella phaffii GS115]SCV11759.1 Trafficking protein particle complex subunit 31 [Komaga
MSRILSSAKPIQGIGYDPLIGPQRVEEVEASANNSTSVDHVTPPNFNYDRNLHRMKHDVSLSSFSFLFCELVSWSRERANGIQELEKRLNGLGYTIGLKYLELLGLRENYITNTTTSKNGLNRDIKIIQMLEFIHTTFWKALFGKTADNLERSQDNVCNYMITDNDPLANRYISVPSEFQNFNCSAFVAGIIEGMLDSAYFQADVSAHTVETKENPNRTVFLIQFDEAVIKREQIRFGS